MIIDLALTWALSAAALLLVSIAVRVTGRPVRLRWLALAVAVFALYWVAEIGGQMLQARLAPALHWNWLGKVFAILFSLALMAAVPGMDWREVGLSLRQRRPWLIAVLMAMALACAISWGAEAMAHDGRSLKPERLLFQATLPGLDEELFWRGVFLALLVRALGAGRPVLGAPFGAAEGTVTLLFGLGHAVRVSHGAVQADLSAFLVTGVLGALFMWLRTRTGSLATPTLTHNLCNFGDSFF